MFFAPLLAAVVGSGGGYAVPAGPVASSISEADRPVADRAAAALASLEDGSLDPALLTPAFREQFSKDVVAADASFLRGRGAPKQMSILQRDDQGTRTRYTFVVTFNDNNSLSYTIGINKASNLIDALYFRPYNTPQ